MAGGNLTLNCSASAIQECSSRMVCPVDATTTFGNSMRGQIWRVNALLLTEAILAGVIVGIGAYGQRYRHHPITRFIFLGATTLFLPILSSVVSTVGTSPTYTLMLNDLFPLSALVASCDATDHYTFLIVWAFLVQIVMINTSTLVAVDDREGQSKGPPFELLVQGVWTLYLGLSGGFSTILKSDAIIFIVFIPFPLLCSKIVLKYYAFQKARRSFALGRNPGLVFVHMQKLQAHESNQHVEAPPPPPLLVMREEGKEVEMQPRGYSIKDDDSRTTRIHHNIGLVTIDKVWQLDIATPKLKDLCLSFALFKLLRCRFARYKLTSSMGTLTFFRSLFLKVGEHDRVFGLIVDELSFVHDYYYSSLPISYSNCSIPIVSIFLSLLTIGYCTFSIWKVMYALFSSFLFSSFRELTSSFSVPLLHCEVWCIDQGLVSNVSSTHLGRYYLDLVPLLLVLVLAVAAEIKDMASYICSNWTKVTLICRHVNRASSPQHSSPGKKKWVNLLLRCRCKLMKHWDGKMSQCSVLVLQSRRTSPLVLVRRLLPLPDHRKKVKVTAAVKVCIINALRSIINGSLSNGVESLRRSQVGESFIWACDGKGTSDTILVWHIATCILEVKHPYGHDKRQGSSPNLDSDHKIVATHLSRYCAYLVTWCPELLPDNNAWSKSLHEAVKKDAECAVAGHASGRSSTPEDDYQKLVELLSANAKHEVLKNGVELGKQLVETINDKETTWKLLADFWSEMILYVAPSENLKGHSEAIARGGELITLLWALLFHAGIVSRPGEDDGATAASGVEV
ncbi:uncharacterized protein LOC120661180 [Panicum virgatum]|uniref:DUF4220 domain-containing protein n=1 Tax=Panicum virgatum TaxID=38727 RepID=A0A8T0W1E3_PANVG|nr:uncharacterized protein LOC120661180 [Panicum virgatum]KAG2639746.1 hypothetical protein PVAP13_2KG043248 [Panicum virgatum]